MRISDWSSDVCSSDLAADAAYMKLNIGTYNGVRYTRITLDLANPRVYAMLHKILRAEIGDKIRLFSIPKDHGPGPVDVDRKSVVEGKRVSVRVDLGGRRIIKKKKTTKKSRMQK